MRAVVQRVSSASVKVDDQICGAIERGLVVLVGVARDDRESDAEVIAAKIAALRIFNDASGAMNLSVAEVGGGILAVSQFTLYGDARKGRRPSFIDAAAGPEALPLFERVVELMRREGLPVETGIFGATMQVSLVNEGPVTILLDSRKAF
jgi:D-tyrosyl-tRNA(Tyr) deacylase